MKKENKKLPIYDYRCTYCEYKFEQINGINAENPKCPECDNETKKLISNINFVVHGSSNRSIDCVVGADAEKRWNYIYERKEKREKERKVKNKGK